MPYARANDGTHLFFQDQGAGNPVLFLHGWSLSSQIWEYSMQSLTRAGLRCVAFDRRGHGRSDQPGDGYDFDTLADDLAAVITHVDLQGVTLVGHSMGAGEVVRYLSRHGSERIARAMLVAPVTPRLMRASDNPGGLEPEFFEALIGALSTDRPGFLAAGIPSFLGSAADTVSPAMVQWLVGIALQASARAVTECVRAYSTTDFRPDLQRVSVPTSIVHGDADSSAPLDLCGRPTQTAIGGSELCVYEGAPHALFLTERARFDRDLIRYVGASPLTLAP